MKTMPGNLAQQDYAREARRLFQAGVSDGEIFRVTGMFVRSNDGRPLRFVGGDII